MSYEVYDNGKLAGYPYHDVDPTWKHPTYKTFEEAQTYAQNWLGEYSSLCPTEPNQVIDYSGEGDTIEIREIK